MRATPDYRDPSLSVERRTEDLPQRRGLHTADPLFRFGDGPDYRA